MNQSKHKRSVTASPNTQTDELSPAAGPADIIAQETDTKKATASSPVLFFMLWFGIPMLLIIGLAFAMGRS